MNIGQQEKLFQIVAESGANAGFTCFDLETLQRVAARFPNAPIHYDGYVDEEKVLAVAKRLRAAPGEMEKITVKKEMLENVTGPITVSLEVL